ncbi:MAG: nitrate/nitrite transporter NrtS [Woeseia sp.]
MNESLQTRRTWLQAALNPAVVRRSTKVSMLVGTVLVAINQGDLLLSGVMNTELFWKIPMTYCVPYAVSTYASVVALLQ